MTRLPMPATHNSQQDLLAASPSNSPSAAVLPHDTPQLMGILNTTPDSFSDGGRYLASEAAVARGLELLSEGAAIVDVGGESTAPGSTSLAAEQEIARVLPVVEALAAHGFVSIDTYKSTTAEACLRMGAKMVNDVSALRFDPELRTVIREHGAWVVLMHSKEADDHPHASITEHDYENVVQETADFLKRRADYALAGGIAENRIVLDPGLGRFLSHDPKYSWEIIEKLDRLKEAVHPFPLLFASSRKGFLGGKLSERDPLSQLSALAAVLKGAWIVRTHRVSMAKEFLAAWKRMFS